MKTFYCDQCRSLVFFENNQCLQCGSALGFLPDVLDLSALKPVPEQQDVWQALAEPAHGGLYRQCQNGVARQVCNWMVPVEGESQPFCASCRLNQTIPELAVPGNLERWHKMEQAKRRLLYTLFNLGLPLQGRENRPSLQFSFLGDAPGKQNVMTGHENGLITLSIAEADDAEREKRRINLNEPYRTLLGHFRHEIAHYYWDQLIADTPRLTAFRELFGDETQDYGSALKSYYAQGAPADWQTRHVTAYASAHPWEDWAETWAHYLHIVDTLETAAGFGIKLIPDHPASPVMKADPSRVEQQGSTFDRVVKHWLPLTYALNSLNRGMGLPDLYPFVLSPSALTKMRFIHDIVQDVQRGNKAPARALVSDSDS